MTDNRKYKGKWFLVDFDVDNKPHRGSEAFDGVLKFDPFDGAVLTLRCREIVSAALTERVDVFLGETDKGQVTLYSCLNVGHGIGRGSTYRYTGDFVFEGGFLFDPSASRFSTLYAELHNLNEWVDKSTIKISRDTDNNVTIKVDKIDNVEVRIDDQTLLKLRFFSEGPKHTYFQDSASLKHHTQLIVERFNEPISMKLMLEVLRIFQYFLMLCINKPTFPTFLTLYTNVDYKKYGRSGIQRVAFRLLIPKPQFLKDERVFPLFKMLFGFEELHGEIRNILSNWYRLYHISPSSFDLVFERYYTNYSFSENDFLNLAQAVESYHAKQKPLTRIPIEQYEKMKNDVLSIVSNSKFPEYHSFLKSQFVFGNYASLHDRIGDILDSFSGSALFQILGDRDDFIKAVKWTRNYYTHYDRKNQSKAKSGEELYLLGQRLKILFLAMVLVDAGMNKEIVVERFVSFFKNFKI